MATEGAALTVTVVPELVPVAVHPGDPAVADSLTLKVPVGHWPVVVFGLQVTPAVVGLVGAAQTSSAAAAAVGQVSNSHCERWRFTLSPTVA
jgi:hypothetical protein